MRKRNGTSVSLAVVAMAVCSASASIISVNFPTFRYDPAQIIAPHTTAGLNSVSNWNNVAGSTGTMGSLIDSDGNVTGATINWSSSNTWSDWYAADDAGAGIGDAQLALGFLDDGFPGAAWSLTGHGYAQYDVILYLSTDLDGGAYHPFNVNGTDYSVTDGNKTRYKNSNWDETNTITITDLAGDLIVDGVNRNTVTRGTVAGFQIIQIPEPGTFGMLSLFGGALLLIRRRCRN